MRNEEVKKRNLAITSITAVLFAATVAISIINMTITNNAYASDTSQAAAVSNSCLNPTFDTNTIDNVIGVANCGDTVSQQEESGQASAPITQQIANPTIEVQRATTTQPPITRPPPPTVGTCEECFDILTATQQSSFEELLSDTSNCARFYKMNLSQGKTQ